MDRVKIAEIAPYNSLSTSIFPYSQVSLNSPSQETDVLRVSLYFSKLLARIPPQRTQART